MEGSYTIQISSNLVNRLAGDEDKPKKKTKKSKPKVPQEARQLQNKVKPDSNSSDKTTSISGSPHQPPGENAELEALRSVVEESERAVERLQKQEADKVQELTERAKELHDKEFKLPYQKPMPCLSEKNACLECYKEHSKDPLRCADVVKTFNDCVRMAR